MNPTLNLVLKKEWFDMWESGEKTEDYRDLTPYWERFFVKFQGVLFIRIHDKLYSANEVMLCLSHGYEKNRRQLFRKCLGLRIGVGRKEWGASGEEQYIIVGGSDGVEM